MSPTLSFRGQPFLEEDTAGAFLERALSDPEIESVTMLVAWARFGGLRRFKERFQTFRRRGGQIRLILGIDEGIATVPGLTVAIEVADRAFVFHDRTARTFHPKIYLAEGSGKAILAVGSSNLTAGGLYSNYEASLEAEFTLPAESEEAALLGAREYVAKLLADKKVCKPLDESLLARLVASPRYAISKRERRASTPPPKGLGAEEVDHEETGEAGLEIFGSSKYEKPSAPGLSGSAREELKQLEPPPAPPPAPPTGAPIAVATWTKVLPASDAQHPPSAGSNPLGNVRLTKAGHAIDWLTWFRHDLFGPAKWKKGKDRNNNDVETAAVVFDVTIAGKSQGLISLRVDHAPHRESKQANHATVLHWGPLGPLLRATDYTGYVLTLQRMSDGSYRLDISP